MIGSGRPVPGDPAGLDQGRYRPGLARRCDLCQRCRQRAGRIDPGGPDQFSSALSPRPVSNPRPTEIDDDVHSVERVSVEGVLIGVPAELGAGYGFPADQPDNLVAEFRKPDAKGRPEKARRAGEEKLHRSSIIARTRSRSRPLPTAASALPGSGRRRRRQPGGGRRTRRDTSCPGSRASHPGPGR